MNAEMLRASFREFAGEEKFRKFVHALNTRVKDRLFHWQEQLWRRFLERSHFPDIPFDVLKNAFHFCEVHGCELESDQISSLLNRPPSNASTLLLFPYVHLVKGGAGSFQRGTTTLVEFCPECRRIEEEWVKLPRSERSALLRQAGGRSEK